jgi:hypothetical protein
MSSSPPPAVDEIAWLGEIGFTRNPELQAMLRNNFVTPETLAGNRGASHQRVPIPNSLKFPKPSKSPTKKLPSLVSVSAKTQYESSEATVRSPIKQLDGTSEGRDKKERGSPTAVNASTVLRTLDKQVEDWLATVVRQAGHSVVVPSRLHEVR